MELAYLFFCHDGDGRRKGEEEGLNIIWGHCQSAVDLEAVQRKKVEMSSSDWRPESESDSVATTKEDSPDWAMAVFAATASRVFY